MEGYLSKCYLIFTVLLAHTSVVCNATTELKIGFLYPYKSMKNNSIELIERLPFGSALILALESISSQSSSFPNFNLSYIWNDTHFSELVGLKAQTEQWVRNVDVFIGPGSESTCTTAAKLAASFNVPMISYLCTQNEISNKEEYPTTARSKPSTTQFIRPLLALLKHYNWSIISVLYEPSKSWLSIADDVENSLMNQGIEVAYKGIIHKFVDANHVKKNRLELEQIKNKSRIVLLLGKVENAREFVLEAHRQNMTNGSYVYIMVEFDFLNERQKSCNYWYKGFIGVFDGTIPLARVAFHSVLVLVTRPYNQEKYKLFESRVVKKMSDAPFFFKNNSQGATFPGGAGYLYDAVYLYALAINKTLAQGGDPTDGKTVIQNIKHIEYESVTGFRVQVDDHADVEMNMALLDLQPSTDITAKSCNYLEMLQVGEFLIDDDITKQTLILSENRTIIWSENGVITAPPAVPVCGFFNEHCQPKPTEPPGVEPFDYTMLVVVFTLATVVVVASTLLLSYYRRRKYEMELESKLWKIDYNEIQMNNIVTGFSRISMDYDNDNEISASGRRLQVFTKIGHYRGNVVAIKMLNVSSVEEKKSLLLEFKQMRDIRHDNLNPFIGACVEQPNVCIVTNYCNKGSLEDVLHNENIKLDNIFINSMITDICAGMEYLHSSDIKSHGNLKSSNCVVDSRWVVKITDFGLPSLRGCDKKDLTEDAYYSHLLWRAPELLRMKNPPTKGTQKGDVFSFAIILHEIGTRNYPFSSYYLENKEIVSRVRAFEFPPFRAEIPVNSTHHVLDSLMESCWAEVPEARPDFHDIRKTLRKITDGKGANIMDKMVYMLEEYSVNLENLVEKRTEQWMEEKKKTEELLHSMLPKAVADQLKHGQPVKAENFSEVSIFFSDIVGFTSLSSESTPFQVIDLLNDLYTLFDDITSNYDVYKVETIGDAYMVVSGLPVRNGHLHAREIADMALHLLSSVCKFTIRHRPDMQLKLRIGIHSGPACAGVVGLKMPRYCLFGDTVNTASRMESNGKELKIHISGSTKNILDSLNHGYIFEERGLVFLKGKGDVTTYWLLGKNKGVEKNHRSVLVLCP